MPLCLRVTATNRCASGATGIKATPYHRSPRLGPRPFRISPVDLFPMSFVRMLKPRIAHPTARHTTVLGCVEKLFRALDSKTVPEVNQGLFCYLPFQPT